MKIIDDILDFVCECIVTVIKIMNTIFFGAAIYVYTYLYFNW